MTHDTVSHGMMQRLDVSNLDRLCGGCGQGGQEEEGQHGVCKVEDGSGLEDCRTRGQEDMKTRLVFLNPLKSNFQTNFKALCRLCLMGNY